MSIFWAPTDVVEAVIKTPIAVIDDMLTLWWTLNEEEPELPEKITDVIKTVFEIPKKIL